MTVKRVRYIWLIVGLAGVGFLFMGFPTDLAAGRYAARIAKHLSEFPLSESPTIPTVEQHEQLCIAANALSHLFENHVWTQLLFVLPVTLLAFITFGVLSKKPINQGKTRQPSARNSSKAADGLTGSRDS